MRFVILTKLLLFLPLVSARAANNDDFVIYEAQHRSADELKKAAVGVGNGARVSNLGTKIIVYGTKSQRDGVLKLFAELDHPLANYVVELRTRSHARAAKDSAGLAGAVSNRGAAVTAQLSASDGESSNDGVRAIDVSDGGSAKLYADAGIYPRTVALHLRSIGHSGAHVEIRETDSSAEGEQAIVTELDLPLGEWRSVGGISGNNSTRTGALLARTKRSSMSSDDVQMRVTLQH